MTTNPVGRKDPSWWMLEHESGWEKVRHALRAAWRGPDAAKVPAAQAPGDGGFAVAEPALRFGYGAHQQFGKVAHAHFDHVESKLAQEWDALGTGRSWKEARAHVLHGWDSHLQRLESEGRGQTTVRSGASGLGSGSAGDSGSGTGPSGE